MELIALPGRTALTDLGDVAELLISLRGNGQSFGGGGEGEGAVSLAQIKAQLSKHLPDCHFSNPSMGRGEGST